MSLMPSMAPNPKRRYGVTGDLMAYQPYKPLWLHRLLLSLRTVFYTFSAIAGFGALFLTPITLSSEISFYVTKAWGGGVLLFALVAMIGVVLEQYRFEFAALPWIIAGLAIYAATTWAAIPEVSTRLTQAGALSALVIITMIRAIDLLIVHRKLTAQHELA